LKHIFATTTSAAAAAAAAAAANTISFRIESGMKVC
jgi:hypothetical protein